jgi:hypothetical protein
MGERGEGILFAGCVKGTRKVVADQCCCWKTPWNISKHDECRDLSPGA